MRRDEIDTIRLDDVDCEILDNALFIYMRWLNRTLDEESIPELEERSDETQGEVSLLYMTAKDLRGRIIGDSPKEERDSMKAHADDFRSVLRGMLEEAEKDGGIRVDITAGSLHREVGGYPGRDGKHRMPIAVAVMKSEMRQGDRIIQQPPSGKGASFEVRFVLPR